MPMASTFDATVNQIIKHRLDNGAITARHKLATDPVSVGNELEDYTRQRLGVQPRILASPKQAVPRTLPQAVWDQVAAVAKMADGVGLLMDFIPYGTPVSPELAAKRGEVCDTCPRNSQQAFGAFFTQPASERLQKMVEARTDLKLETPFDANLGVCEVCLCPMKLKVHVPLDTILEKTKPSTMAEFPSHCWIAKRDQ